jgi:hypothetical protein
MTLTTNMSRLNHLFGSLLKPNVDRIRLIRPRLFRLRKKTGLKKMNHAEKCREACGEKQGSSVVEPPVHHTAKQ